MDMQELRNHSGQARQEAWRSLSRALAVQFQLLVTGVGIIAFVGGDR